MRTLAVAFIAISLAPAAAFADGSNAHDGLWEITSHVEITGFATQMPPQTHTQCVTQKSLIPRPESQKNCEMSDLKIEAGTVSWTMKCNGPRQGTGSGSVTYHTDSMEGTIRMSMANPKTGSPMEAKVTLSGKRIGDCTK